MTAELIRCCAFTGHRPQRFPWKGDETDPRCAALKKELAARIRALAQTGVTDFLTGMAQGADTWAALAVLELRKESPGIRLNCILPYKGQAEKWDGPAREQYRAILKEADTIHWVSREYSKNCYLNRNRFMVDRAGVLLAVFGGPWRSGTGATIRYAQRLGREIILLEP